MKPNRPDAEAAKHAAENARTKQINEQRARAKELLSEAKTKDEVLAAVQQAGVEIASSELSVNRMTYQPEPTANELAHLANLEALRLDTIDREVKRLEERDRRAAEEMARRNADVDFVANEMKLHKATRYFSG